MAHDELLGLNLPAHEERGGGFDHDRGREKTKHEWITPPDLVEALGEFDLDPCAVSEARRPWPVAKTHFDAEINGLIRPWVGRVFCNPPYDNILAGKFLGRCAEHQNCIALIFARTETENWQRLIFGKAHAILFLAGRLYFRIFDGSSPGRAGAPSALVAYGENNVPCLERLASSDKYPGFLVRLKP